MQLFTLSRLDAKAAELQRLVSAYVIDSGMELCMELNGRVVLVKDHRIVKEDGFVIWTVHVQHYLSELSSHPPLRWCRSCALCSRSIAAAWRHRTRCPFLSVPFVGRTIEHGALASAPSVASGAFAGAPAALLENFGYGGVRPPFQAA